MSSVFTYCLPPTTERTVSTYIKRQHESKSCAYHKTLLPGVAKTGRQLFHVAVTDKTVQVLKRFLLFSADPQTFNHSLKYPNYLVCN